MSVAQWPEIKAVLKEGRCEVVLKSIGKDDRFPAIDDEELQNAAFQQDSQLNFVSITGCGLSTLYDSITRCSLLTRLVLVNNNLTSVPDGIGSLEKLKFMDLSQNQLTALPSSFSKLTNLETFNAIDNKLTDDGLFDMSEFGHLHILDLSRNELTRIPSSITSGKLVKLHTLYMSFNKIEEVTEDLDIITQLKDLKLAGNQIKDHPAALARMHKIKALDLSENPFRDNPFKKLTNDKRIKVPSVLSYIYRVCPEKKEQKAESAVAEQSEEPTGEGAASDGKKLLSVRLGVPLTTVKRLNSVKSIRPHLVCCVMNNLDLSGANLKKFIKIQTDLHSSALCANRTAATIGTHEMTSFAPPLQYLALPAEELNISALHKKTPISARELVNAMVRDAELARKRVKRNTLNPMHRYLELVQKLPLLPCLIDSTGLVISLAPLTNCDITKMSVNTKSVWVEVTSGESLEVCKEVMDVLVDQTMQMCPKLTIDQVRVLSEDDDLVSVYPDKNDLPEYALNRVQYTA